MARNEGRGRPLYELRVRGLRAGEMGLQIWQLPSPATPRLRTPEKTATLKGRALGIVETKVLRRLRHAGIRLGIVRRNDEKAFQIDEDLALNLGLMFRTLAPMRSIERMRRVAEGIDRLSREEAGYWMGMAIHRKRPRRVLAALRVLLTAN